MSSRKPAGPSCRGRLSTDRNLPVRRQATPKALLRLAGGYIPVALVLLLELAPSQSSEPRIAITGTNNAIQLHYEAEPGRTYVLQYSTNFLNTNWSNMQTGYNFPFPVSYHLPDGRTNAARFYRLLIMTP